MEPMNRHSGMVGVGPFPCRVAVVSVQNSDPLSGYPANVNLAAAISYTVRIQVLDGTLDETSGAIPSLPRWPSPWLVEAFPVGAILPAGVMDGVIYIDAREERWAAPCGFDPSASLPPPTPDDI